jgi:hypothetical protein
MRKRLFLFFVLLMILTTDSWAAEIDLSKLANYTNYEAKNGDVLTGSTNTCTVTIAANATVTLKGVKIIGYVSCIQCKGSAIIILADGTENTLTSQNSMTPAIMVGDAGTTLTIKGKGILNATGSNNCAGIGCSRRKTCGNINIEDGIINAIGGEWAAGIGSGYNGSCGTITIKGGTITAVGGQMAAGIGVGRGGSCGAITITKDVIKVVAYSGEYASCTSIATVYDESGTSVTIEDISKVTQK